MKNGKDWRVIVASSLAWEEGHASLDSAVKDLPAALRGKRPERYPHSLWELVEHIRITQRDLLDFAQNADYTEKLEWPKDYWPASPEPPNSAAWDQSIADYKRDREAFARFTAETNVDLTSRIPHGKGQTYLRTILLAVDHASYHVGQIVSVRRLLSAWPQK
jgi:uncharacterized damage-inducible protein DinB